MINGLNKRFLFFAISALSLWIAPMAAQAVGISPVLFEAMGLLQGSSIQRHVFITRTNPAEDEKGMATVIGDAAPYIRLPNDGRFTMPKGVFNTSYDFFIEPGNLAKGEYEVKLRVEPVASAKGAAGATGQQVLAGAEGLIRFSVTTEAVEAFTILNQAVSQTEEGQILDFTYRFNNVGNVDTRPSKIDMEIRDVRDPSFVYRETISQDRLKIVKALSAFNDDIPTKANLVAGSYIMKLTFYKGDAAVFNSGDMPFQVAPRGTFAQQGELQTFVTDKSQYDSGEVVGFKGTFKNTGRVGVSATLGISLYRGDKRVDVLGTDATFVPAGQIASFEKTYRPDQSGLYTAAGTVAFGSKISNELRISYFVKSKIPLWSVLLTLASLFILLALIIRRILKKLKQEPPMPPMANPLQK